jgi:gliding motility-associated-like protein
MNRGELLLFLLVVGFFSIDFFKGRTGSFFDSSSLPPKITQWELDSCTRTVSIQSVAGGIPPYDFYVFKQEELNADNWQFYRLIKEQLPQISGLPPGNYRIKAVNEGISTPNSSINILAVSFPSDPELEVKGSTSLCSGGSPAIALQILNTEVSLPFRWTARVLLPPDDGEVLGYSANPTVPRLGIFDTLINTGTSVAKVEYGVQAIVGDCMLPSQLVEVLVDPLPRVEANASERAVCSGTPFSISFLPKSWGSSPMQLRWTAVVLFGQATGLEKEGTSSLNPLNQTLSNRGTSTARVRYTFIPSFQDCEGVPASIEIEVLPELALVPQQDLVFCSGELVSIPEFTTNLSGATIAYFWEVSDPSIGIDSSTGSGSQIPSFVAINTSASPKQTRITVTPRIEDLANGISCAGTPSSFLVTVRASIQVQEELSNYAGYGVSCAGSFDGKILLEVTGGRLPSEDAGYIFSWTGPEGFLSSASSLEGLQAGVYRVQVSVGGNCLLEKSMELTQADSLRVTQSQVNNLCFQGISGSLLATPLGGIPPYSYSWTGPNNFSASVANPQNLVSGTYQVTVTDANGCAVTGAPQTITEPAQLALTQRKIDNVCFQGNTGGISTIVSGGTAPYSCAWTGPNNFVSTVANPQNLVSGTYQVTITDANGCAITGSPQTITEPAALLLSHSKVDNVCFQGNTGGISITASGGTAPYSYSWTGPNNFNSRVANPQNLVSGTYQLTVTDANGCPPLVGPPITLTEPQALTINAQVQSESCADAKDARIELTLTGGTPPYILTWEHGDQDAVAGELGAGTYRVRVTDEAGCSQTAEYSLLPIPPLSLQTNTTLQATQVPLQISALLQAQVAGGTPPYTYGWNTGQSSPQITVAQSGVYRLEVQDSRGCKLESQVTVNLPLPMSLSLQLNTVPLCENGGQETTVQLQLSGGLPPYQITWSRGTPSSDGRVLVTRESGVFDLEVRDALGLLEKRTFTIIPRLTGPLEFTYLFDSQVEFQGNLVGFAVNFSPQATWPFIVISWDFGDGTSTPMPSPIHRYATKGTYLVTLTVLDAAGCLLKTSREMQVLDYYLEIPNVFTPNGDELNDTFFPKFRFIRNLELQVMNLWGELIYRSLGQDDPGWDGFVSGQKAPEGVYVYKLRYQVPGGRTVTYSSTFLLAR